MLYQSTKIKINRAKGHPLTQQTKPSTNPDTEIYEGMRQVPFLTELILKF